MRANSIDVIVAAALVLAQVPPECRPGAAGR
jgi:hypothetical protein